MLVAEQIDSFQSCSLNRINYTMTHHINFNGLPLGAKEMLGNGHPDSTSANTLLLIFYYIILWRLGIKERTQ
jgi:hypothetical protein